VIPPFHVEGDDEGHFYALATVQALFRTSREPIPSTVVLYYSPSPEFSRYSIQSFDADAHANLYSRGPDYSETVEAALIDFWECHDLPAWAWTLFPASATGEFAQAEHAVAYAQARAGFVRALYGPRMRRHTFNSLGAARFFDPPPGGFHPGDAMADTDENREIMAAVIAAMPDEDDADE